MPIASVKDRLFAFCLPLKRVYFFKNLLQFPFALYMAINSY